VIINRQYLISDGPPAAVFEKGLRRIAAAVWGNGGEPHQNPVSIFQPAISPNEVAAMPELTVLGAAGYNQPTLGRCMSVDGNALHV
jgi:hypothetical protein